MIYANAGDKVTVISMRGEIAIVSDKDGMKFSCKAEDLTDDENIVIEKPIDQKIIIHPVQVIAKTKAKPAPQPSNQSKLF